MNRYEITSITPIKGITISFDLMTDNKKLKHVTISEGDLVSMVVAKNKQQILDPVTDQKILGSMIYRGRIIKIELLRCRSAEACTCHNPNKYTITLDCSKENDSNIITVNTDIYLLDINEIDHVYGLDDPEPLEGLEEVIVSKNLQYPTDAIYLRRPIIIKESVE